MSKLKSLTALSLSWLIVSGCATNPPAPTVLVQKVPVKVPCIDRSKVPVRPGSAMDPSADIGRLAFGASADLGRERKYADEWEAHMRRWCGVR